MAADALNCSHFDGRVRITKNLRLFKLARPRARAYRSRCQHDRKRESQHHVERLQTFAEPIALLIAFGSVICRVVFVLDLFWFAGGQHAIPAA